MLNKFYMLPMYKMLTPEVKKEIEDLREAICENHKKGKSEIKELRAANAPTSTKRAEIEAKERELKAQISQKRKV